jgi:hypothetical protein
MSGVFNQKGDWIDLDRSVEIKNDLIAKFMQQDYLKEYNEPFRYQLLGRLVNNLLERELKRRNNE